MGCCVSSTQKSYNPKPNQKTPSTPPNVEPEEEIIVVKEVVISELTPKIPELTPKIPELHPKNSPPPLMKLPLPTSPESPIHPIQSPQHRAHETVPFRRREKIDEEEEEEEKEVAVVGPPAGGLRKKGFSGEFSGAGGTVRTAEMRGSVVVPARGNVGPTQFRRGPGEEKWLRSRSPATGGEGGRERRVVGKGMSVRTGTPVCRSFDGSASTSTSNMSVKSRRVVVERKDTGSGLGLGCVSESLENPLVSLECFIFL